MWLAFLGLINGIIMGLVYSIEELWFGVFFCLVPFAGILLMKKKVFWFVTGYGLGYYITGLSFLFKLTGVLPLPVCTAHVLMGLGVLAASIGLTAFLWMTLCLFEQLRQGNGFDIFILAGLYALAEWLQGLVPVIAFPWFRLAVVATAEPIWIQGASLFGSLFVSFLIFLWNAVLARILVRRRIELPSVLAIVLIGAVLLYGEVRLYERQAAGEQVLILQGNHEGGEKWAMDSEDILSDYMQLMEEHADSSISLILMPETALPYAIEENRGTKRLLLGICRKFSTEMLVGGIAREVEDGETEYYNAVYHVTENGIQPETYHKQILVPFGEYLPFASIINRCFPWMMEFMAGNYFEAGEEQEVFETKAGKASALICYESIFGEAAREAVEEGAEFLTVVSNDSWFQGTPAMRQHHAHAILRAVETDRYVLRAGNTGISSVIDNRGRVQEMLQEDTRGVLRSEVNACRGQTLYVRVGECFPLVLGAIYILLIFRQACILIFSWLFVIIKRQRR